MPEKQPWPKEKILAMLEQNSFGYQNVPLPHGLSTGGVDRSETAKAIFSEGVENKSVFDLGCKFGFFCFYAEERGATRLLGVDIESENVRRARLLAECRGSSAEFERLDIEREPIAGAFDYVLCLNVLHHLRNPVSVLEKLISATREKLVLELAGFALRDRRQNGVSYLSALLLARLPVFYLARRSSQTFFITTPAIRTLLMEKRADFARVDIVRAGPKGRPIIIAHRRRILKLVVVAGMPAAGKSTLISHLLSPPGKHLADELGIDQEDPWQVLQFGRLQENREPELGCVMLHYNITKHLIDGDLYQHSNCLSDLISVAGIVRFVTLICPIGRLQDQFLRFRAEKGKLFANSRRRRKIKKIMEVLKSPNSVEAVYADWFSFVDRSRSHASKVVLEGTGYSISP